MVFTAHRTPVSIQTMTDKSEDLSVFVQGLLVVTSTSLTGFYIFQRYRQRCTWEVVYVTSVTMLMYAAYLDRKVTHLGIRT